MNFMEVGWILLVLVVGCAQTAPRRRDRWGRRPKTGGSPPCPDAATAAGNTPAAQPTGR